MIAKHANVLQSDLNELLIEHAHHVQVCDFIINIPKLSTNTSLLYDWHSKLNLIRRNFYCFLGFRFRLIMRLRHMNESISDCDNFRAEKKASD